MYLAMLTLIFIVFKFTYKKYVDISQEYWTTIFHLYFK